MNLLISVLKIMYVYVYSNFDITRQNPYVLFQLMVFHVTFKLLISLLGILHINYVLCI